MRKLILLLTLSTITLPANAQKRVNYITIPTPPKTIYLSAGPTYFGVHAEAGVFLAQNTLVGLQAEAHNLLSTRREAGGFIRKYGPKGLAPFYLQAGVSYGRFQEWDFDIDNETPGTTPTYRSFKFSGAGGMEFRITRLISAGAEARMGRLADTNWWQPSLSLFMGFRLN